VKKGIVLFWLVISILRVFSQDTIQPQFPGGNALLLQYLSSAPLPVSPYPFDEEMVVNLPVKINALGNLEIFFSKPEYDRYDSLAYMHINRMPKWHAGIVKGDTVGFSFVFKVVFNKNNPADSTAYNKRMNDLFYNAGVGEFELKSYRRAAKLFRTAITYNAFDFDSYHNRAACEIKLEDTLSACKDWHRIRVLENGTSTAQITKYCTSYAYLQQVKSIDDTALTPILVMPEFPGGDTALPRFIAQHTVYPQIAKENDIDGTVYIHFEIDEEGKVENVSIARGVDKYLDKESLRVVRLLPQWKPGTENGKPVRVEYTVPIRFKLN
jgi:TonB family protein